MISTIILLIILIILLDSFNKWYKIISNEPDYDNCKNTKRYKISILENNYNNIKSGDLLLFSAYNYDTIVRTVGDLTFSHIGIVVIENGIIYSFECFDYYPIKQKKYYNSIKIPLKDRINSYSGNTFIISLNTPLNKSQEDLLIKLSYKKYKFQSNRQLILTVLYNFKYTDAYFCSSFIIYILIEIGLLDYDMVKNIHNIYLHKYICNIYEYTNLYGYPTEILSNDKFIKKIENKTTNISFNYQSDQEIK